MDDRQKKADDQPLTPAGRLFLRPEMNQIINCLIGLENPIDVSSFKAELSSSPVVKHPRFCSLLVHHHGREHWQKTTVDVDRHVIIVNAEQPSIEDYVADLTVSCPLPLDKPLWEFHLLMAHNCVVVRIHHAFGDGISLVNLLLSCCRMENGDRVAPGAMMKSSTSSTCSNDKRTKKDLWKRIWRSLKVGWFTVAYVVGFIMSLWLKDRKTVVSGGDGVELWPRKLVTESFSLKDMKLVKNATPDVTINDVLFGIISSGLSKYLTIHSPKGSDHLLSTLQQFLSPLFKHIHQCCFPDCIYCLLLALPEGRQLTGVAMVNLRNQSVQELSEMMNGDSRMRWGNRFGMMLLPVYYHKDSDADPLRYLKRSKVMLDTKKLSLEALFTYIIGDLIMSTLGSKAAAMINKRVLCHTTFTFSNIVGPQEKITAAGNPVTYLRVTSSALPQAIVMHMVSYAGRADMQISVAKDVIHYPQFLAKCFEDALLEMKQAATKASNE